MKEHYQERYEKMGLLISVYRRSRGMTQLMLGNALDVDAQHISRIERAVNGISLDMLFAIADELQVKPHQLLDFDKIDGIR